MNVKSSWLTRTDPGSVRTVNEDSVAVAEDLGVVVVADGMGGHNAGAVASNVATQETLSFLRRIWPTSPPLTPEAAGELLTEAINAVGMKMYRQSQEDLRLRGMGATVVAAVVHPKGVCIAHVGDSRAYLLRGGALQSLTKDHSLVEAARAAGVMGAAQMAASHNRHLVSRALGLSLQTEVTTTQIATQPGDILLLCTDGLNDMVDDIDIELTLNALRGNLALAASVLVTLARDAGGHDNITLALWAARGPESKSESAERGTFFSRFSQFFGTRR